MCHAAEFPMSGRIAVEAKARIVPHIKTGCTRPFVFWSYQSAGKDKPRIQPNLNPLPGTESVVVVVFNTRAATLPYRAVFPYWKEDRAYFYN